MCCFSWLSALFGHSRRHSSDAPSQPLSQELQDRIFTSTKNGYRTLESMPQLPAITVQRDTIDSTKAPEFESTTPTLSLEHSIGVQTLESMPQLPAATVKRGSICSVKASTTTSSTPSLSSKYPKIIVRSIDYPGLRLRDAKIAYSIGKRHSWHWLPYERLVEGWGKDVIRRFDPTYRDGL